MGLIRYIVASRDLDRQRMRDIITVALIASQETVTEPIKREDTDRTILDLNVAS